MTAAFYCSGEEMRHTEKNRFLNGKELAVGTLTGTSIPSQNALMAICESIPNVYIFTKDNFEITNGRYCSLNGMTVYTVWLK